jgi:hypothetical protein
MGHGGLEGFVEGHQYHYEHVMSPGIPSDNWYRVFHTWMPGAVDNYHETCGNHIFKKHFTILTKLEVT